MNEAAAKALATSLFEGQVDRGGVPVIQHMERVIGYLENPDEHTRILAWLHDVVEDTKITFDDLRTIGFSEEIIEGVDLLTHNKKKMKYPEYIDRLCSSGNSRAIKVKIADQRDNTDPMRQMALDSYVLNALQKKYRGAMTILTRALQ